MISNKKFLFTKKKYLHIYFISNKKNKITI